MSTYFWLSKQLSTSANIVLLWSGSRPDIAKRCFRWWKVHRLGKEYARPKHVYWLLLSVAYGHILVCPRNRKGWVSLRDYFGHTYQDVSRKDGSKLGASVRASTSSWLSKLGQVFEQARASDWARFRQVFEKTRARDWARLNWQMFEQTRARGRARRVFEQARASDLQRLGQVFEHAWSS